MMDEVRTWDEVAQTIRPDILADIVDAMTPGPTIRERVAEWVNRPRGTRAILAYYAEQTAQNIRIMQGRE